MQQLIRDWRAFHAWFALRMKGLSFALMGMLIHWSQLPAVVQHAFSPHALQWLVLFTLMGSTRGQGHS